MTRLGGLGRAAPLAIAGCAIATAWCAAVADARMVDPVVLGLAACTAAANRLSIRWRGRLWISGSFTFSMLAAALYGPAAAFVVAAAGELGAWALERYRPSAAAINLVGSALPNLVAATLFAALVRSGASDVVFASGLVIAGTAAMCLNFLIVAGLTSLDAREWRGLRPPRHLLPSLVWNVGVTAVLGLAFARSLALLGGALLVLVVLGFAHMLRLSASGRRRAEASATSSLGLVEGLVGTLQERDPAAARHAAAVAAFSHDVTRVLGIGERECGVAHLAGLLHDVGRVALSDDAIAGRRALTGADWVTIHRHPRLGAEMVGVLGEVANVVRSHHERPDGRGYPDGLRGEEIPVLARIVAVAEVYDTLTASDGYRERMSSFEAVRELRRVAGTQLDPDCVDALVGLLEGRSTAYRHADGASVEDALGVERALMSAVAAA
jgi:HD-GYP domain-containing protein (c-di-GMP phosphodiesterase class II)